LGSILKALGPVIEVVGSLVGVALILVDVLLQALVPVLEALVPVIEFLAPVIGFLGEVLAVLIGWIAKAIEWLIQFSPIMLLFGGSADTVGGKFKALGDLLGKVWGFIKQAFSSAVQFLTDLVLNWTVVGLIIKHWDTIKTATVAAWTSIKDFFTTIWNGITAIFSNAWDAMKDIGRNLILGLINGIKSMAGAATDAAKDVLGGVVSGAKNLLGISSPSKVFADIGGNVVAGFQQGLDNLAPTLQAGLDRVNTVLGTDLTLPGQGAPGPGTAPAAAGGTTVAITIERIEVPVTSIGDDFDPQAAARAIRSELSDILRGVLPS